MKPIYVSLTKSGDVKKAIKQLEQYKQTLNVKGEIFLQRLAEIGIPVINARIGWAQGDSNPQHSTYISVMSFGEYSEARLIVEGVDILFLEFGAGVHFNGSAGTSPRTNLKGVQDGVEYELTGGKELGYTIGSYGKGQGKKDFWFYTSENGDTIMSYGTEAAMPLYHATMEIINSIQRIAKEVYGG